MKLFNSLGFEWDSHLIPKNISTHSIERACFRFHKMMPEFVWDAAVIEGNPFTFPEVKTLLDGITVGGHKLSDQEQILNLAESSRFLLSLVKKNKFTVNKETFTQLNGIIARKEALGWGVFRGEGNEINYSPYVALGEKGRYQPLPTIAGAQKLNEVFHVGLNELKKLPTFEQAITFFLFGALQQFFFDGNKRTSRFMMNGILMSHGIDAISIPAAKAQEFNEKMVDFYLNKNANEIMKFIVQCHPEYDLINSSYKRKLIY